MKNNILKVVIIGRQNVGKSTLFNRLIKNRKAIIDPTPGVTRDLVYGDVDLDGLKIRLIDSGGISDEKDITNKLVQEKTSKAQSEADLILFVVEAGNPLPIEEEFISIIRKSRKDVVIAMNKSDSPEKDIFTNEYFEYGLGEPIPVSAEHNRNIDVLIENIKNKLKDKKPSRENAVNEEKDYDIRVTILGKPNVGKSSLLNCIVRKERSIVSPIPGTTRDIVDEEFIFNDQKFLILDTAGIRKKSRVTENVEYYSVNRAIKSIQMSDVVFLVIDSLDDISDQDKKISTQIVNNGKGLIVVLNKWDLHKERKNLLEDKKEMLFFKFPLIKYVPVIPVSAKTGEGIKTLLQTAMIVKKELYKRIETSDLNVFILDALKSYAPSSKKGVLKVYYGTQTRVAPVEFVFFINKKDLISNSYKQYIINKLRDHFGFSGIPISVYFKDKQKNKSDDK
jgi:GTPase